MLNKKNKKNKKVVTIGISGASCSGKTTLARWLVKILPNTKIFYQDDFFKPENEIPIDSTTNLENWDCPEAIDFHSFTKTLHQLRTAGTLPSTFISKEDKNERKDIETIELHELVKELSERVKSSLKDDDDDEWSFLLVDGFLLYVNQDVIDKLDIKLFVKAEYDTLKLRRETRAGYVTLEGYWVDPPNYFNGMVWPNYVKANKHIIENFDKVDKNNRLKNVTTSDSGIIDDLMILESDHVSMLSKNIEMIVMMVLDHIRKIVPTGSS